MGSVFRAFQEQAYHSTRCTPVYIEFEKVASGVVIHPGSKLMCILIHDIEDGSELGSLIVAEVMRTFVSDYQEQCHQAVQMDVYQDFHQKLPESLYAVQIKILQNLSNTRGIKKFATTTPEACLTTRSVAPAYVNVVGNFCVQP